jgi:hypothetical protein
MNRMDTPRDVLVFLHEGTAFVSAVDSCGAVGFLPHDALEAKPEIVGQFTARTALLEVLSAGAAPAFASVSVCNGPEIAAPLLAGIRTALGALPVVISTEKNMPTVMTALGVTVTGFCPAQSLRLGHAGAGDLLCCAGTPLVGAEIRKDGVVLPSGEDVKKLLDTPGVHAVIPVGSQGAAAEAKVLAAESGLCAELFPGGKIDLYKSAGPSSCVLFAAEEAVVPRDLPLPVTVIGRLRAEPV